jgi:hypothetical protein
VVLYTEIDLANGFSTPLPYNIVGVFLSPPDEGELLDNSPWLDLLLVHEFTHVVHLDKVRGAPRVLQAIFGRVVWFIPNLFEPGWVTEGLAVYNESDPAAGRGRLRGPMFEAWLRAERASGFLSLAEINSDGRALPLSKQYLYGAYFMEFLARRYGPDKVGAFVERYSGNIVPRLHSGPYDMTGKMMDELWVEFLADLAQQVDARAEPIRRQPEVLGPSLLGTVFDIPSIAALPGGALLAVLDDGLGATHLVRVQADGTRQRVTRVNRYARVNVAADGSVLVTQPDVCNTLYLAYDLYRLDGDRLQQLTSCAHLRRAVQVGPAIVALQLNAGGVRLVQWESIAGEPRVLHAPTDGTELVDLAAAPDGRHVSVVARRASDWQLLEYDLGQPGAQPRLVLRRSAPMHSPRYGRDGLELVAAVDGQFNVWRVQGAGLQRLTHSHTAVVAQAGTASDGSLATVVVAPQGYALHRLAAAAPLQELPASTAPAAAASGGAASASPSALSPATVSADAPLGEGRPYSALRAIYPRSWLPAISSDRGLTAYGASTSGGDALGWHRYAALAQWETSQKALLGAVEYSFVDSHSLALSRTLTAQAWTGDKGAEHTTVYDRHTKAQWLSLLPFTRLERKLDFGIGAALDVVDRVDVPADSSARRRDERLLALLADFDTSGSNWYAEGPNRGLHATLLYETYRPLVNQDAAGTNPDGSVLRADLRGFLPLGRTVLALRLTEAHATGLTVPFQLGGATDEVLQFGPVLNNRVLSLRGYRGDESELLGRNARVASVEWRTPLADIDRHGMAPPFGINRLSATVFYDAGGAWNAGGGPDRWHRGVGFELLAEAKLLYALGLQLRLGLARGLDQPRSTIGYLTVGRGF